jgi:hypothetical protein
MNTDIEENPTGRSDRRERGRIRISELQAKNIIAGASYLGPILFLALHRSILGGPLSHMNSIGLSDLDLFGMPTGGAHHDSKTNDRGES